MVESIKIKYSDEFISLHNIERKLIGDLINIFNVGDILNYYNENIFHQYYDNYTNGHYYMNHRGVRKTEKYGSEVTITRIDKTQYNKGESHKAMYIIKKNNIEYVIKIFNDTAIYTAIQEYDGMKLLKENGFHTLDPIYAYTDVENNKNIIIYPYHKNFKTFKENWFDELNNTGEIKAFNFLKEKICILNKELNQKGLLLVDAGPHNTIFEGYNEENMIKYKFIDCALIQNQ